MGNGIGGTGDGSGGIGSNNGSNMVAEPGGTGTAAGSGLSVVVGAPAVLAPAGWDAEYGSHILGVRDGSGGGDGGGGIRGHEPGGSRTCPDDEEDEGTRRWSWGRIR